MRKHRETKREAIARARHKKEKIEGSSSLRGKFWRWFAFPKW